jgi:hypothetical protein
MSIRKKLGIDFGNIDPITTREDRIQYINFKLASLGLPIYRSDDAGSETGAYFIDLLDDIIKDYKEKKRMVDLNEVGIYRRINEFFSGYFGGNPPKCVANSLILDHYGLAREMSLPPDSNTFSNEYVNSYRIKQGVLHNPRNDRRTTEGSFHIVEGGLAIPYDKKAVPKEVFLNLYEAAVNPPEELMLLPFTAGQKDAARTFVSLLVKPIVSPKVPGVLEEKRMEILFVAPGSLVSNLDFVESYSAIRGIRVSTAMIPDLTLTAGPDRGIYPARPPSYEAQEKGSGPPIMTTLRRGSGATVCAGAMKMNFTTEAMPSRSPAAAKRGGGDPYRRQLLRLFQEGNQDADQLCREPFRQC